MALNACTSCTTKFAVGLPKCPHCGSTEFVEDGDVMAKITRHGGASDNTVPEPEAEAEAVEAPAPETEEPPAAAPEPEPVRDEAGEPEQPAADVPEYGDWTVEQLKEQLAERDLPKSGKRDDLVARLVEDDTARAADTETVTE